MKFENLTPEQQEQVKACKTPEDMLKVAKSIGYQLSDEELDSGITTIPTYVLLDTKIGPART